MRLFLVFTMVFMLFASPVFAHCGMCGMGEESVTEVKSLVFKADIICLGCALKKEQGAKAQCSLYGHKNALRTKDGEILTILENDVSTELINSHDYAGKTVEIKGKRFPGSSVVEVESFKIVE